MSLGMIIIRKHRDDFRDSEEWKKRVDRWDNGEIPRRARLILGEATGLC